MAPMGDCAKTGPPFQPILAESSPKGIKKLKKPLDKPLKSNPRAVPWVRIAFRRMTSKFLEKVLDFCVEV